MFLQNQKKIDFNKCVFPNCENGEHNNYRLFKIPKNPDRQKLWLDIIGK